MPLLQFFQRLRPGASPSVQAAQPLSAAEVEQARTRARRRMIGMAVLVGAGVIGFSWLFETQPRPLPADVQVVSLATARSAAPVPEGPGWSASGDDPGSVALPAPVRRAQEAQDSRAVESQENRVAGLPTPAAPRIPQPAAPRVPEVTAQPARGAEREEVLDTSPPTRPAPPAPASPRASATAPARPAASKPDATRQGRDDAGRAASSPATATAANRRASDAQSTIDGFADTRFIVQVGAFSDVASARAARLKVERLGIKTYTQAVDTPGGRKIRVRVGPYVNKADADRAMAALKKAGMAGALLTL